MNEPITRSEMYLAALGGEAVTLPDPLTREELYLAYLNGMTDTYPEPITRTDQYLYKLCQNGMGSGGGVTIRNQNKTITENGSYKADSGYTGLGTVTVNVPQEDPVLQDKTVTENGTVTADAGFDGLGVVTVNVTASGGGDSLALSLLSRNLTVFSNKEVTELGPYALAGMVNMETVDLPNVVSADHSIFMGCTKLTNVNLPELTTFVSTTDIFKNCSALKKIYLPKATASPGAGGCPLEVLHLPKCNGLGYAQYKGSSTLKTVVVGDGIIAGSYGFAGHSIMNCSALKVIAVATSSVTGLVTSLAGTPFAEGASGGYVLVPSNLIETYKNATNWSAYYAYGTMTFLPWEDYTIDGTVTGAPDWDKINALHEEASA